jgi:DNA polymerase III epsilon subunit-like protein
MSTHRSAVILDFETTGLDVAAGAVVEIAAVRIPIVAGKLAPEPSETFHSLVVPRVPIEPEAEAIHGISDSEARSCGREPAQAFAAFRDFYGDSYLVAHNGVFFDFLYLAHELERYGLPVEPNRLLDTLPLARAHLKSSGYALAALCETYGIVNERAHRASSDVHATSQLLGLIVARQPDVEALWRQSYGYTMVSLLATPAGFELLQRAIDEKRSLQIEYAGAKKPMRKRWILPIRFDMTQGGHRSVRARCLESNVDKQFRLDRIRRLIALG